MKSTLLSLLFATAALVPASVRGGDPASRHAEPASRDPFAGAFFPPEVVLQAREQIGVSDQQIEMLKDRMEKLGPQGNELRQRLEQENAALAALAQQDKVDEAALLAQLDKVLAAEREMKHLHLSMLVAVKNQLTPDQQAKVRELMRDHGAKFGDEVRRRLSDKVSRVQAGMQKWAESQRDPSPIARAMQEECKPLLDAGKPAEAEAVLDRLLQQLEGDKK